MTSRTNPLLFRTGVDPCFHLRKTAAGDSDEKEREEEEGGHDDADAGSVRRIVVHPVIKRRDLASLSCSTRLVLNETCLLAFLEVNQTSKS